MGTILHFHNPKMQKEYIVILDMEKSEAEDIATREYARPGFEFTRAFRANIESVDLLPLEDILMRD